MERPISKNSLFVSGAARFKDLIYVIAKDRNLAKQEVEHARFIAFYQLKFAHMGDRNWSAIAVCVAKQPAEKMIAVGEDGDVFTYVGGTATDEIIEPRPNVLRGIGVIEGFPYACGMKRQVYKRTGEATWIALHAPDPKQGENAGFEAIDGFSEDEIYAVGWNGEIWQWDGRSWSSKASPTNLILTAVACADDGNVYICGQNGTIIRGRGDQWDAIAVDETTDDLWDILWFQEHLYIATMTKLYRLEGDALVTVSFGADAPATCYGLTSAEGVLWSVGSADIFSYDGSRWSRVD